MQHATAGQARRNAIRSTSHVGLLTYGGITSFKFTSVQATSVKMSVQRTSRKRLPLGQIHRGISGMKSLTESDSEPGMLRESWKAPR